MQCPKIDATSAPGRGAFVTCARGLLAAAVVVIAACDRPPSADSLREWTPRDHHSSDDDRLLARDQASATNPSRAGSQGSSGGVEQLIDLTWRQQCTTCHGASGHGDGQMGAILHPPDLTSAEWQSRVTDGEMIAAIKNGKNRMPRFDFPDPVLRGLVARVRSLRAR